MGKRKRKSKSKVRIPVKKRDTGYKLSDPTQKRRRKLYASTDKRLDRDARYLQAARRANALAILNKNRNRKLSKIAESDADYYFKKAKQTK